jgi:hypothetical protein
MTDTELQVMLVVMKTAYGDLAVAHEPNDVVLMRADQVALPKGCSPTCTPVLLRVQPGQARPEIFVKPGIVLPNGVVPRSTSTVTVGGETWLQFSYSFPWDASQRTVLQFVETSLRRFAKTE